MQTRNSLTSLLLGATVALACAGNSAAQVAYSFDFNTNSTGWTGNFTYYTGTTTCGGTGGAMRRNLWSSATTGNLVSPLTGTSIGGTCTITFDYKVNNWSANTVGTPAPFGTVNVQYGATATGPWTTFATFTDEAQTSACINKTYSFNPPAGALYIKWDCIRSAGTSDAYWNFDNVNITESAAACSGTPAPGNTVGPAYACVGSPFSLSLQNATSGTGVSYQWFSSTVGSSGPWTPAGTSAIQSATQTVATWYYCAVTCSSATGNSTPLLVPIPAPALPQDWSTGVVDPNCWAATNLSGAGVPFYNAASGFGIGTGSAEFNFYSITSGNVLALTSPVFPAFPAGQLNFDVAGANYNSTYLDQMVIESSIDGGVTWVPQATMDNSPTGLLNTLGGTGYTTTSFVPTAAQWASRSVLVPAGANRFRFRGVSGFGNNVFIDNVSFTPGTPAHHTAYGTGCYSFPTTGIYEFHADAAVASAAMQGNALLLTPTAGSGYLGTWLPGTAAAFYVAPSGTAANVFATASDDGSTAITTSGFFTPTGTVTSMQVDANGVISLGAQGVMGYTPTGAGFCGNLFTAFGAWHDYNEAEAGSGRIKYEEVGGVLYVTWDGVENYSTNNPATSTVQFQFTLATGTVMVVFQSISNDTTSTYGSAYVVGWKANGAVADAGTQVLSTVLPATTNGVALSPLTLSASPAPINNGPAVAYTITNIPEIVPGSGLYVSALFASLGQGPGIDLGFLGAPGCSAYILSIDVPITMPISITPTASVSIPFSTAITPVSVYFQGIALFNPAFPLPNGQNAFGMTTSNGLESYVENY